MTDKKKILIVEDDEDFQDIYALYFRGQSFEVIKAMDGKQALEILEKDEPDLIILDLIMPIMDGEQFYIRLRKNPKWQRVPVIIASVNDKMPPGIVKLGGISAALKKPFDTDVLLEKVQAALK